MDAILFKGFIQGGRAFLVPIPSLWWQRLFRRPEQYEVVVFSNKTVHDLPIQCPYSLPPDGLSILERHQWRVEHGFSYITDRLREVLQDE